MNDRERVEQTLIAAGFHKAVVGTTPDPERTTFEYWRRYDGGPPDEVFVYADGAFYAELRGKHADLPTLLQAPLSEEERAALEASLGWWEHVGRMTNREGELKATYRARVQALQALLTSLSPKKGGSADA